MKKIVIATLLLSAFAAAPAVAAGSGASIGVNYGLDFGGMLGIEGNFDISAKVNQPVSVKAFYKKYSEDIGIVKASYTAYGAAGIYDLSSTLKLDKKIKPYAGLGLYSGTATASGGGFTASVSAPGGLYITGGAEYSLTHELAADVNYNNIGGITIGVNYSF